MFDNLDAEHLGRLRAQLTHASLTDPDFGNAVGALLRTLVDEALSKRPAKAAPADDDDRPKKK